MRTPIALTFALLLAGLLAPAANGATVAVQTSDQTVYVSILGGPEDDRLTVSSPEPGRYTVTQAPGLPLAKGGNRCEVVAPGRVDCVAAGVAGALLMGGDGRDRLEVSGPVGAGAWLFGGNGDDELFAGPGADRLDGETGLDVLHATDASRDTLACEQRIAPPAPLPEPDPGTPAPADPLAPPLPAPLPPAPAPVGVGTTSATLSHGAVPLRVSCSAAERCHGWITVRLLPRGAARTSAAGGPLASSARSRRPVISRRRYSVGAGRTKTVKAQISRRGRQRVLKRRSARCSGKVSSVAPDGSVQVATKRITIKAGGSR